MTNFNDQIDDYSDGAEGTLTTPGGQSVGYTVSSNTSTRDWGDVSGGARVNQASGEVTVNFDEPVTNAAIFVSSSNIGEEYIVVVDGVPVDLNVLIANGDATFHDFGGNQIVDSDGNLTATGSFNTYSTAVLQFHIPVSSLGARGDGTGGGWDIFDIGFAGDSLPCFASGTLIETPKGAVAIEEIRAGDLVETLDNGPQPVLWAGLRYCSLGALQVLEKQRPVQIAPNALGRGVPSRQLQLSRQHRVMLTVRGREILVPAIKLVGRPGVRIAPPTEAVTYHHLLFAQHEVLVANGASCESLLWAERSNDLTPSALRDLPPVTRAQVAIMTPARPIVERARVLRTMLEQEIA